MSETTAETAEAPEASEATEQTTETQETATTEVRDPEKLLNAYNAEKDKRKQADAERRDLKSQIDAMQAKIDGKEKEHAAELAKREVEQAALAKADERILKAEVRAAAASKLADPADALLHINLSEFEVGSDGEVDAQAINDAIDDLITKKPYLAAQGKRFQGSADGGARTDASKPTQLNKSDLDRMTPEAIVTARQEGRLDDLMGVRK